MFWRTADWYDAEIIKIAIHHSVTLIFNNTVTQFTFYKMDEIAEAEVDSLTIQSQVEAISRQSEENFSESEISSTIEILEEGLRIIVKEVQGLHNDMEGIERETENLKKRMRECSKLAANDSTEWS